MSIIENHIGKSEDLITEFDNLPDDSERGFELYLTNLVKKSKDNNLEKRLLRILKLESYTVKVRYAAFYALTIKYRYDRAFAELEKLIDVYQNDFSRISSYSHVRLLYRLSSGQPLNYTDIEEAYQNSVRYENHDGIVHMFADMVVTFYENYPQITGEKKFINEAVCAVDKAIILDKNYAKYHATKSRLLYILCNYEEALYEIDAAISMESPRSSNYMINMYAYQNIKMKIVVEKEKLSTLEWIENKHKTMKKEIDTINDSLIKNIELIAFFAGVVALVIGSLQFAANQPLNDAIKLIIILFGSLLSVFAGFGFVLHGLNDKKILSNFFVFILGVLVTLIASGTL